jgi:hypothetical protein
LVAEIAAPAGALTVSTAQGSSYLVRDRAARDGGRVVVFTDATDQRRAEAALAEQTQALAQCMKELSTPAAATTIASAPATTCNNLQRAITAPCTHCYLPLSI